MIRIVNRSEIPIPSVVKIRGPMELGLVILRFAKIKLKLELKVIFLKKRLNNLKNP